MHETLLSDEILNRILSYCLFIPPEVFLQFPTEARGNAQAYQTKKRLNYLLVSKRWLKIAKPLLYTSVILRKNAHTKAVAVVLQDCPGLSKKIDTLRLEGGYGRDFSYIVAVSPNIKHLYLNLELASSDTIAGMRKSLTTMDPTNFYAHQVALSGLSRNNQTVLELRAMMETCISSRWANLVSPAACNHSSTPTDLPLHVSRNTCISVTRSPCRPQWLPASGRPTDSRSFTSRRRTRGNGSLRTSTRRFLSRPSFAARTYNSSGVAAWPRRRISSHVSPRPRLSPRTSRCSPSKHGQESRMRAEGT
ncbi:uncharacterized protein PHACADRAFT_265228 [Phanerochaete carnosa HHB-10118-sp]|uniref:F-box domain-containing protein n=1 Tax=Phanerochaete carnosa (strain HHB-10118-sp) TaxID=650164 RepID=K5VSA6_PHACS|nr:uncharacterized protein PHACADRAFT_265228 [Phanerochaete carnosa HHB-10118-sp]EKM49660.1 hypothetical protein PHACADRAFT_265228 [Phanerochaete carnosa HHB-10118-sp]